MAREIGDPNEREVDGDDEYLDDELGEPRCREGRPFFPSNGAVRQFPTVRVVPDPAERDGGERHRDVGPAGRRHSRRLGFAQPCREVGDGNRVEEIDER